MEVGVIIALSVLGALPFILLACWLVGKKGRCRRTRYSHDITVEKSQGEILAVVSPTSRNQEQIIPSSSQTTGVQNRDDGQHIYSNIPQPPLYHSYHVYNPRTAVAIHSLSAHLDRRNLLLTQSERIRPHPQLQTQTPLPLSQRNLQALERPLPLQPQQPSFLTPPYITDMGGPPSYQHAMNLKQLRNSIR